MLTAFEAVTEVTDLWTDQNDAHVHELTGFAIGTEASDAKLHTNSFIVPPRTWPDCCGTAIAKLLPNLT